MGEKYTFHVRGTSLKEVQKRVADHEKRGAELVGEIKEHYYQSKTFNNTDYCHLRFFGGNYEKTNYVATMQKESHAAERKKSTWGQGIFR